MRRKHTTHEAQQIRRLKLGHRILGEVIEPVPSYQIWQYQICQARLETRTRRLCVYTQCLGRKDPFVSRRARRGKGRRKGKRRGYKERNRFLELFVLLKPIPCCVSFATFSKSIFLRPRGESADESFRSNKKIKGKEQKYREEKTRQKRVRNPNIANRYRVASSI